MKWVSLFFLLVTIVCHADPDWMIRVEKSFPDGSKITGTGYALKMGEKYFVRTAAHVTLGSSEGVELIDQQGKKLLKVEDGMLANNALDDQIFEVQNPLAVLGNYSPTLKQFVVEAELAKSIWKSKRQVVVSSKAFNLQDHFDKQFYISPERIHRSDNDDLKNNLHNDGISVLKPIKGLKGLNGMPGLNTLIPGHMNDANSGESRFARVRVIPGESGSPVIGHYIARTPYPLDMAGKNLNYDENKLTVVSGHVLSYHRLLRHSNFLAEKSTGIIISAFNKGKRGSLNGTEWEFHDGTPYRKQMYKGKVVEETHFGDQGHAGDGTGGHGGDGTGGHGGEGDASETGRPLMGILIDGKTVYAFQIKPFAGKSFQLYANWENFQYLIREEGKSLTFEAIDASTSLARLILTKRSGYFFDKESVDRSDDYVSSYTVCFVGINSLKKNKLNMYVAGIGRLAKDLGPEKMSEFTPLESKKVSNKAYSIDYRGLWSVDFAMVADFTKDYMGMDLENHSKFSPFIAIASEKVNFVNYDCAVIPDKDLPEDVL